MFNQLAGDIEMNITQAEYWKEVNSLAESIAAEAMEQVENDREAAEELINDTLLHETIDSHQWVIYNAYNLDVIQYSDNTDYMIDTFGNEYAGAILAENGLYALHNAIAFWALYVDVQEYINDALDKLEG